MSTTRQSAAGTKGLCAFSVQLRVKMDAALSRRKKFVNKREQNEKEIFKNNLERL